MIGICLLYKGTVFYINTDRNRLLHVLWMLMFLGICFDHSIGGIFHFAVKRCGFRIIRVSLISPVDGSLVYIIDISFVGSQLFFT